MYFLIQENCLSNIENLKTEIFNFFLFLQAFQTKTYYTFTYTYTFTFTYTYYKKKIPESLWKN